MHIQTVRGAETEEEARQALARFVGDVFGNKFPERAGRRTVEDVCREWIARKHERANAGQMVPGTVDKSQAMVRHLIREIGRKRIDQLKVTDL